MARVLCVDFGSTFTKAVLVDTDDGTVVASGSHRTTIETDVLDGYAAIRETLAAERIDEVLACSSAGGGLRLAVVGYEREVTAEAGHRVGLSAGAKVVHVTAGLLSTDDVRVLRATRPDVVLLVGGTDGGNSEVLRHNARRLATGRVPVPVVVAGNADGRQAAVHELASRGRRTLVAANVLPRIGVLDPEPARAAIREVFIRHVIGGKGLSRRPEFARLVRAATPDAVLTGVAVLSDGAPGVPGVGDVLVVDVGGATTDVYSVVTPSGEDATLRKEVVQTLWRARTVEGDLGMRWNAVGVVDAAAAEHLAATAGLRAYAGRVAHDPGFVPTDPADDAELARLAVTVALRRHGRPGSPASAPRALRDVSTVVGSGGVLRHNDSGVRRAVLAPAVGDHGGGWRVPRSASLAVDAGYLLFAAGLLAEHEPRAAAVLVTSGLVALGPVDDAGGAAG